MHRMCCCFHYLQRKNWNKVLPFWCQTFSKAIDLIQIWNKRPSTQQQYGALVANVSDNQWIKRNTSGFRIGMLFFSIDALLLRACALFCSVNIETLHYGLFYSEKKKCGLRCVIVWTLHYMHVRTERNEYDLSRSTHRNTQAHSTRADGEKTRLASLKSNQGLWVHFIYGK